MLRHTAIVMCTILLCTATAGAQNDDKAMPNDSADQVEPSKIPDKPISPKPATNTAKSTVDEMTAAVLAAWKPFQSLSAKVATLDETAMEDHTRMWEGNGQYDCQRKGEKLLVRLKTDLRVALPPGSEPVAPQREMETFCDGEIAYFIGTAMGEHRAYKTRLTPEAFLEIVGPGLIAALHSGFKLTMLPDATVDGRDVFVAEVASDSGIRTRTVYIDKKLGVLLKTVVHISVQSKTRTITYSGFKTNPKFPDDHFTFVLPTGVDLFDRTKQGPGPQIDIRVKD